jgi:hypothetical protein
MIRLIGFGVSTLLLLPLAAGAQPLGVFRWQLQPYCNLVTLAVTQNGGVYRVEGTDDQCGTAQAASVIGTAFQNPDGSVGMGLNIVAAPSGAPVHVEASITVSTLSGTWHDSAGRSGTFAFTPGAGTGGSPRPVCGTIGAVAVNPAQVQLRVNGSCSSRQFMQSIAQSGSVVCGAPTAGGPTSVVAGPGLIGGGSSGSVTLSLPRTASGAFQFNNGSGLVAADGGGTSPIPTTGPGTRMMWYSGKLAFRAGRVTGTHWDDTNIGPASVALGYNTVASGSQSVALGSETTAIGDFAFAMGQGTWARGALTVGRSVWHLRLTPSAPLPWGGRCTQTGLTRSCSVPMRTR